MVQEEVGEESVPSFGLCTEKGRNLVGNEYRGGSLTLFLGPVNILLLYLEDINCVAEDSLSSFACFLFLVLPLFLPCLFTIHKRS